MKIANLIIGLVVFSLIMSMMFSVVADVMERNNVAGFETFVGLSGEYDTMGDEVAGEGSTTKDIKDQLQSGEAQSVAADINLITGAISGGRKALNFMTNFDNVINNATGDINTGTVYIDPRLRDGALAIFSILFILAILFFLRGFKAET